MTLNTAKIDYKNLLVKYIVLVKCFSSTNFTDKINDLYRTDEYAFNAEEYAEICCIAELIVKREGQKNA